MKDVELAHIKFETAKLAHEKGLRISEAYSDTWYNPDGSLQKLDHVDDYVSDHFHGPEGTDSCIVRVTHDLLRDWLRVNHNIHVWVKGNKKFYSGQMLVRPNHVINVQDSNRVYEDYYKAYEETLINALKEI